jgi:glycosyltransferase involved in cell wall biosynthesis
VSSIANGISVVVMAYDEAATLLQVVDEIRDELSKLDCAAEIIIVDDGSKDGTSQLADKIAEKVPLVRVVHHSKNLGLGGVYRSGFSEARLDFITFFPADGQFPAPIISQFFPLMQQHDLVLGFLPNRNDPWIKKCLSGAERVFYRVLFGVFPRFQGIFMCRREILNRIPLVSSGSGWAIVMELILRSYRKGYRLISVPTEMRPRASGHSKVTNWRTIRSNVMQLIDLRRKLLLEKPASLLLPIALVLVLALHFRSLMRYPAPFTDEAWFASRAWAYCETHRTFGPLDRGVFDRFAGYWTYFPWLPNLLQSLMYWNSDSPNLYAIRLLSVLGGIVLAGAVFSIGKRIGGPTTAWLSIFLLLLSRPFFFSAHLARYDILVAAFGFSAIALALKTDRNIWIHLIAGLAIGAAFETHPNGALFGPVVLALYFLQHGKAAFKDRKMWSFVSGVSIGLGIYAALHIVQYPETWLSLNRIAGGDTHLPPLMQPTTLLISFRKFISLLFYSSPYLSPVAVIAILYFIYTRTTENKMMLVIILGILLMHNLLIQHKFLYYAILFSPAFDLAIAHFVFQVDFKSRVINLAVKGATFALILCSAIYTLLPLRWDWSSDFKTAGTMISRNLRPEESVMGNQLWWFILSNHEYRSWEELYYFRRYKPDATLEDAFREFRPHVFIIDDHVAAFIKEGQASGYAAQLGIRNSELKAILAKYGRLRGEFDGGYYGKIRIYEMRW